jgi:hypothetical protein
MFRKIVIGTMSAGAFMFSMAAFAQQTRHVTAAEAIATKEAKCNSDCVRGDRYCGHPNGTSAEFCSARKTQCVSKCKIPS